MRVCGQLYALTPSPLPEGEGRLPSPARGRIAASRCRMYLKASLIIFGETSMSATAAEMSWEEIKTLVAEPELAIHAQKDTPLTLPALPLAR